tara:strand:- start:459 stop:881 length:423 start_codon:yes stop_codon:yes gene_type:complete
MKNMEGKNNYLNDRNNFELIVWLKNNQISLEAHKATMIVAAEMASHDLGFLVTEGNIRGKLEQFPECRWKKTRSEQKETALTERLREVEEKCRVLGERLAVIDSFLQNHVDNRLGCLEEEMAAMTIKKTNGNGRLFEVQR